jgi:hypothetical protein
MTPPLGGVHSSQATVPSSSQLVITGKLDTLCPAGWNLGSIVGLSLSASFLWLGFLSVIGVSKLWTWAT